METSKLPQTSRALLYSLYAAEHIRRMAKLTNGNISFSICRSSSPNNTSTNQAPGMSETNLLQISYSQSESDKLCLLNYKVYAAAFTPCGCGLKLVVSGCLSGEWLLSDPL